MGGISKLYDDFFDGCDYSDEDDEPKEVSCKYCGSRAGLWWDTDPKTGRWVLMAASGERHLCRPADATRTVAKDFEDLD